MFNSFHTVNFRVLNQLQKCYSVTKNGDRINYTITVKIYSAAMKSPAYYHARLYSYDAK